MSGGQCDGVAPGNEQVLDLAEQGQVGVERERERRDGGHEGIGFSCGVGSVGDSRSDYAGFKGRVSHCGNLSR